MARENEIKIDINVGSGLEKLLSKNQQEIIANRSRLADERQAAEVKAREKEAKEEQNKEEKDSIIGRTPIPSTEDEPTATPSGANPVTSFLAYAFTPGATNRTGQQIKKKDSAGDQSWPPDADTPFFMDGYFGGFSGDLVYGYVSPGSTAPINWQRMPLIPEEIGDPNTDALRAYRWHFVENDGSVPFGVSFTEEGGPFGETSFGFNHADTFVPGTRIGPTGSTPMAGTGFSVPLPRLINTLKEEANAEVSMDLPVKGHTIEVDYLDLEEDSYVTQFYLDWNIQDQDNFIWRPIWWPPAPNLTTQTAYSFYYYLNIYKDGPSEPGYLYPELNVESVYNVLNTSSNFCEFGCGYNYGDQIYLNTYSPGQEKWLRVSFTWWNEHDTEGIPQNIGYWHIDGVLIASVVLEYEIPEGPFIPKNFAKYFDSDFIGDNQFFQISAIRYTDLPLYGPSNYVPESLVDSQPPSLEI
jgi:hypothetical protein